MLFKSTIVCTMALAFASSALGAAINQERASDGILIATNPVAACNCPNNCDYKQGHSCKYYSGPSDSSAVYKGHCNRVGGTLTCVRDG